MYVGGVNVKDMALLVARKWVGYMDVRAHIIFPFLRNLGIDYMG
jgi:hypothetical protein